MSLGRRAESTARLASSSNWTKLRCGNQCDVLQMVYAGAANNSAPSKYGLSFGHLRLHDASSIAAIAAIAGTAGIP